MDKQSFFQSINMDTIFDDDFFKKVYGYSICDKSFLDAIATKLINLGMSDMVATYNMWYEAWKAQDDLEMKKVAEWFHKECDKQYEKLMKVQQEKAVNKCNRMKTWEAISTLLNYQLN